MTYRGGDGVWSVYHHQCCCSINLLAIHFRSGVWAFGTYGVPVLSSFFMMDSYLLFACKTKTQWHIVYICCCYQAWAILRVCFYLILLLCGCCFSLKVFVWYFAIVGYFSCKTRLNLKFDCLFVVLDLLDSVVWSLFGRISAFGTCSDLNYFSVSTGFCWNWLW